ncbi:PREDICTED: F-box/kelch-repeat protein At1g15670-like [Nelumbo nucifera]|uniref:F-box domain-containing protein n=2 Tax=Nelumbo nucifera TaxID=4432 RepID=A0A822Z6Y0_NELNU|nr:PREDICTED: F-box/kelch-repeat protein At1g15670-like [Nelumbo nucifera]DAD42124.1 TPA_asm: hypothetical protein HUJ06_000354 [Nelumbo nucifera]
MSEAEIELIPNLPEEIGLECLIRLPYTEHRVAARVCRRWRELLESRGFYYQRKQTGYTHKVACLVQSLPVKTAGGGRKPAGAPFYGITVFDPVSGTWERLHPVPNYPDGLPLFCQLSSVEGKLVLMGGWNPVSWEPVKDVFVFDFTIRQWRRGKDMPSKRSFFASGSLDGKIFVAGGHDENKNALKSAWSYDVRRDEWEELSQMTEERDECEGVIIGNEFWVVSGYSTENQGRFESSAECYELETGRWRRVEGAWPAGRCPRVCVGVEKEKDGKLFCWAESDSAIRVGACGVGLGERTLVTGSPYMGAPQGVFLVEAKKGQNGKLEKIDAPDEFSGFVQSGCCVEI